MKKEVPNLPKLQYTGTNNETDIKIFVSHRIDYDSEVIDQLPYIPVRCGAIFDDNNDREMLGDDTGDNISAKRMSYCELTVQYWAWKNVKADYYGLCHYRRYFSFSEKLLPEDIHGAINCDLLGNDEIQKLNLLNKEVIHNKIDKYDFIISQPAQLKKVGIKSVYEQYSKIPELHIEDLDCALSIVKRLYPDYTKAIDKYIFGSEFFPCNMFIMKREIFNEYCEWLFTILDEIERTIDTSLYSMEGRRTLGHIAERLLGIFYTYIKENRPKCKLNILQRTIIWNVEPSNLPKPAFEENNIPIVFSFSDFFVPYAAVTLYSLIVNSSANNNYDIVVFCTDITNRNKMLLQKMFSSHPNFSIRFYNISRFVRNMKLKANNHVSVETFYRLIVNQVMRNYQKILYLDSDLIILKDPASLYFTDLGKNLAGATIDADHAGEYHAAIPAVKKYTDTVLRLKDPYSYFQAGVILFHIGNINRKFSSTELIEFAEKREYMYVDQDVLNVKFEGQVQIIDPRWNVMTDCNEIRINELIKKAPFKIYQSYLESRKSPFIIHYAGNEKPWNSPISDMADIYWEYARKTPFYEAILWRMMDSVIGCHIPHNSSFKAKVLDIIFPKNTKRREWAKTIYYNILGPKI